MTYSTLIYRSNSQLLLLIFFCIIGLTSPITTFAAGPATVNFGSSSNFVILTKSGISTTGATAITGDIGVSPIAATAITGFGLTMDGSNIFSTSAHVTGKVYAADYTAPTPSMISTAVSDMQTAYTDAAGRINPTATELGAGNIGGMTLAPGLYKWDTGVIIPTDVTLAGGANDVWIFQIAQNLTVSSGTHVTLSGGAQAGNIFWVVAGQTILGTTAVFNGNILDQTSIVFNTGAVLNGRAMAQTAVTLDSNTVTMPTSLTPTPIPTPMITPVQTPVLPTIHPVISITPPVACTEEVRQCPDGSYVSRHAPSCEFAQCPETNTTSATPILFSAPVVGQQTKTITIATNLHKGNRGDNVKILQEFLISQNKGPAAKTLARVGATGYFGILTHAALAEFQVKVGITPAWGNFGPITRSYINAHRV